MKIDLAFKGDLIGDLDKLDAEIQRSVLRPAAHAGAVVLYEEARTLAPVYDGPAKKGVKPGQLRNAIYRVFSEARSSDTEAIYQVSWNATKAPHGHLIERGHWRVNRTYQINGSWVATSERLPTPVWVPAIPFIRRAFDRAQAAVEAMSTRAAERMQEVLSKTVVDDFGDEIEVPNDSRG
jgi:hypothetical protein